MLQHSNIAETYVVYEDVLIVLYIEVQWEEEEEDEGGGGGEEEEEGEEQEEEEEEEEER
jgi:hypothetical protein